MRSRWTLRTAAVLITLLLCAGVSPVRGDGLQPIEYNNPGLVVDLGVGLWAWPLPMDYDRDGDLDLVVSCPDKPYNGTYFFENPTPHAEASAAAPARLPVFKPAVRIAEGPTNVQVSYVDGEPVVMTPGKIHFEFDKHLYSKPIRLPLPEKIDPQYQRYRANQWKLVDWEQDGDLDVIVGLGVWDDYGWDDAWDEQGHWKNGPLHGYVYLVENVTEGRGARSEVSGAATQPSTLNHQPAVAQRLAALATAKLAEPRKLTTADGEPIDVYGMPSPNFADFDGDGDLDLICGEFLDGFTWFENNGTDEARAFAPGRKLVDPEALQFADSATPPLHMDLQMITPVAVDWDGDGRSDLVCGDEDGRVAFLRNRGETLSGDLGPAFDPPIYFQQQAADVKFGALVTPVGVDWDGDGDEDIIAGNTAGYLGFIENLDGAASPRWAAPRPLREIVFRSAASALGTVRYSAGPQGSIQGPCEAKWGYTAPSVADWDHDGRLDIVTNGIWGKITWHAGLEDGQLGPHAAVLSADDGAARKPAWNWWTPEGNELVTQWRTTPCAVDWNGDGLVDLVMLDHEGYLAVYVRSRAATGNGPGADATGSLGGLVLLPPKRLFKMIGPCEFDQRHKPVGDKKDDLLRLNANRAGASGRRKLCVVDWDGDGRLDLLVNSVNVNWLRNVRTDDEGFTWFEDMGLMDDRVLAGHTTSPTTVDWDQDGIPDLLVGAEDGRLYYKRNSRADLAATRP
jgi:hypothetical protein